MRRSESLIEDRALALEAATPFCSLDLPADASLTEEENELVAEWNTVKFDGLGNLRKIPIGVDDNPHHPSIYGDIPSSVECSQPALSHITSSFESNNYTLPLIDQEIYPSIDGNLNPAHPHGAMSFSGNPSLPVPSYVASPFDANDPMLLSVDRHPTYLSNRAPTAVAARPTSSRRRRSTTTSQPRVTCSHPSCHKSYARPSDLRRHALTHRPSAPRFDCPVQGCHRRGANGFLRADKCREHYRAIHED